MIKKNDQFDWSFFFIKNILILQDIAKPYYHKTQFRDNSLAFLLSDKNWSRGLYPLDPYLFFMKSCANKLPFFSQDCHRKINKENQKMKFSNFIFFDFLSEKM